MPQSVSTTAPLRVLLVAYHFPPMSTTGALRVARFALYLPEDIRLTVLGVEAPPEGEGNRSLWEPLAGRVDVQRVPLAPGLLQRTLERVLQSSREGSFASRLATTLATLLAWIPDRQVAWNRAALRRGRELLAAERFDVILCSSPPHGSQLAAARLAREAGVPLVADFRDPWSDNPERVWPTPLHKRHERRLEASVLARAARVLANTPGNRAMLLDSFPTLDPRRVIVLPNGFDPARRAALAAARAARAARSRGDARRVLLYTGHWYAGALPCAQGLAHLLATQPEVAQRWRVRLVGSLDPVVAAVLEPLAAAGLLELPGYVSADAVVQELAQSEALLYVVAPAGVHWIPSKLYDYLLAERPIFAVAPRGDAWRLLERSGLAELVPNDTPEREASALAAFLRSVEQGRVASAPPADLLSEYDARNQSLRLAGILREAAAEGAR